MIRSSPDVPIARPLVFSIPEPFIA